MTEIPIFTATSFWLKCYRFFLNLHFDEHTGLITIIKVLLENFDKFAQYTYDNLLSQKSLSCLTLILFSSAIDKVHEHSHAGLQSAQNIFQPVFLFSIAAKKANNLFFFHGIDCK